MIVVAQKELDPRRSNPEADLIGQVQNLTLLAMISIVEPPRAEAKAAIAECKKTGIRVRMITGDHATTAAAIAANSGSKGGL